jgi:hypothetical protein
MHSSVRKLLLPSLCVWLLAACAQAASSTPGPSPSPAPSATRLPTITPTSAPTASETPASPFPLRADEILYVHDNELRAIGIDGEGDRLIMLVGEGGGVLGEANLSPDGRLFVRFDGNEPLVVDMQSGERIDIEWPDPIVYRFEWSADSRTLFFEGDDEDGLSVWRASVPPDAPPQKVTPLIAATVERAFVGTIGDEFILLDDGPFSTGTHRTILLNWQTGEEQVLLEGDYVPFSISPDHSRLLLYRIGEFEAVGAGTLKAFYTAAISPDEGVTSIQPVLMDDMETLFCYAPEFAPDNRTITAWRYNHYEEANFYGCSARLLLPRADGTYQEMPLAPPDADYMVWSVLWSRDATAILYNHIGLDPQQQIGIWHLRLDGSPPRQIAGE